MPHIQSNETTELIGPTKLKCFSTVYLFCPVQVLYALNHTLSQYEAQRAGVRTPTPLMSVDDGLAPLYTADDLVYQYNCGDLNNALFTASGSAGDVTSGDQGAVTRQINEYFRSELIDKRNRRMAARIDRLLTDRPNTSFFFAFGAGRPTDFISDQNRSCNSESTNDEFQPNKLLFSALFIDCGQGSSSRVNPSNAVTQPTKPLVC